MSAHVALYGGNCQQTVELLRRYVYCNHGEIAVLRTVLYKWLYGRLSDSGAVQITAPYQLSGGSGGSFGEQAIVYDCRNHG